MVSVNVSSKFRSLYRDATGRAKAPLAKSVKRCDPSSETAGDMFARNTPQTEMPVERNRIMQPGKRALEFTGASLISATSDVLEDGTQYKLDIFQRSDGQFITRLNKVDAYGTLRLLLAGEASSEGDVETILRRMDAGKFVSFLPNVNASDQIGSDKSVYVELQNKLTRARNEYSAFISSIFSDSEH